MICSQCNDIAETSAPIALCNWHAREYFRALLKYVPEPTPVLSPIEAQRSTAVIKRTRRPSLPKAA